MKEKRTRKEIFYDDEIGWAEIYKVPEHPNRVWLRASYYLDLSKSGNYRKTLDTVYDIFLMLEEAGFKEIYCYAESQSAFNFNERLGFESINECVPSLGIEFMKRVF